jgi:hypothetical protein
MIGLVHPVGPETAGTYWTRRGFVIGATVVLAIALVLTIGGTSSGSAAQASPSTPASAYPVPSATSPNPLQTAPPTPSVVDFSSTSAATASPQPTASKKKKKKKKGHPKPVACAARDLRPTLTGRIRLAPKQRTRFQLSLINGSGRTCTARVTRKNFELKISSGKGQLWSTRDCPSAINTISRKLGSEHAVAWSLTWNGKRSKANCKSARQVPKPGRYAATARLDGAEPVKLRMTIS